MTADADAPDGTWQRPPMEPIAEAFLSLVESAAMRPIDYSIDCALDRETLALRAHVELLAAMTETTKRLPVLLSRDLQVGEASVDGAACGIERSGDLVWLSTSQPLPAGETARWRLSYQGRLSPAFVSLERSGLWIELSLESFWYPVASRSFSDLFSFRLACELPADALAVANGDLAEAVKLPGSTRYRWVNEAGAPAIAVLAGPYVVRRKSEGELAVQCFVRPESASQIDELAALTGGIAALYVDRFGPIGLGEVNLVVPPHSVGGNWARRGMIVCSQIAPGRDPFGILAHELAHQWWGFAVRFDPMSDRWLEEGLAALSQLSATMHVRGEHAVREVVARQTLPAYERARQGDVPIAECRLDRPYFDELREYASVVFLALLRARMGAGEFDDCLRAFFHDHHGRLASTPDFERAMTADGSQSLRRFLRKWLHDPGLPEVDVEQIVAGLR